MNIVTNENTSIKITVKLWGLDETRAWDTDRAYQQLLSVGEAGTKRTAERRLHELQLLPGQLTASALRDDLQHTPNPLVLNWALDKARSQRKLVLFAQLFPLPTGLACLHANDARGGRYWVPLRCESEAALTSENVVSGLQMLQEHISKDIAIFPHGQLTRLLRKVPS